MKYTKKQRHEIYKKAKEKTEGSRVLCYILGSIVAERPYDVTGSSYECDNDFIMSLFPEFALFEPYPNAYKWFENYEERKTCLEFCIYITSNK